MAEKVGAEVEWREVAARLHPIVINGPRDLTIAAALQPFGYGAVKWAEGQCLLAELVNDQKPESCIGSAALTWYNDAASVARSALANQPSLLAKLGLGQVPEDPAAGIC